MNNKISFVLAFILFFNLSFDAINYYKIQKWADTIEKTTPSFIEKGENNSDELDKLDKTDAPYIFKLYLIKIIIICKDLFSMGALCFFLALIFASNNKFFDRKQEGSGKRTNGYMILFLTIFTAALLNGIYDYRQLLSEIRLSEILHMLPVTDGDGSEKALNLQRHSKSLLLNLSISKIRFFVIKDVFSTMLIFVSCILFIKINNKKADV